MTEKKEGYFENLEDYKKKVTRHELVHAFLFESGLHDMAKDEQLVEWLAIQSPKMFEAMKKTKCL